MQDPPQKIHPDALLFCRNGANLRGYFTRALMDLFELLAGYQSKYGLYGCTASISTTKGGHGEPGSRLAGTLTS